MFAPPAAMPVGTPSSAALTWSALWVFNWHGINMAVLWISGRTALLLTLCATLGAAAFIRRRLLPALVLVLGAMLSKEEAVMLPVVLVAWVAIEHAFMASPPNRWRDVVGLVGVTIVYFVVRA